jgi:hypothetical protein
LGIPYFTIIVVVAGEDDDAVLVISYWQQLIDAVAVGGIASIKTFPQRYPL